MERFPYATLQALLTGIAFAGAVLQALALLTYERIGFNLLFRRGRLGLLALPLLIMTGPMIIVRESIRSLTVSPFGWLFTLAGLAIALCWAVASGHVLLRIIGVVTPAVIG